jgi:hypothetical protein
VFYWVGPRPIPGDLWIRYLKKERFLPGRFSTRTHPKTKKQPNKNLPKLTRTHYVSFGRFSQEVDEKQDKERERTFQTSVVRKAS